MTRAVVTSSASPLRMPPSARTQPGTASASHLLQHHAAQTLRRRVASHWETGNGVYSYNHLLLLYHWPGFSLFSSLTDRRMMTIDCVSFIPPPSLLILTACRISRLMKPLPAESSSVSSLPVSLAFSSALDEIASILRLLNHHMDRCGSRCVARWPTWGPRRKSCSLHPCGLDVTRGKSPPDDISISKTMAGEHLWHIYHNVHFCLQLL